MYLVFTCMPGMSDCMRLGSLLLHLCDVSANIPLFIDFAHALEASFQIQLGSAKFSLFPWGKQMHWDRQNAPTALSATGQAESSNSTECTGTGRMPQQH